MTPFLLPAFSSSLPTMFIYLVLGWLGAEGGCGMPYLGDRCCGNTINTWISKTWLRNVAECYCEGRPGCWWFVEGYRMAMECARAHLEAARRLLDLLRGIVVVERRVEPEWKHVCGFPPRYIGYSAGGDVVEVWGGRKWRIRFVRNGSGWVEVSDGCWSREMLVKQLEEMIKGYESLVSGRDSDP